jgi:Short-chain alcohol dehydrogenase of unknown specificity
MDLTDAVAVVTGASKGLGAHIARTLIHQGATVCGLARSTDALQALRDDLGAAFVPVSCDVRNEDAVESAFETVDDEAGRLDVLVNNAGLGQFGPVDDLDTDAFDVQMDTNVRGVYLCTREAVPRMREQNEATGSAATSSTSPPSPASWAIPTSAPTTPASLPCAASARRS